MAKLANKVSLALARGPRALPPPPHRAGALQPPAVPDEGEVPRLVLRAPHLHAPDAPLHVHVARRVEPEVDDPVREVRLVPQVARRGEVERLLPDEQGRDAEAAQPLEQVVQVRPDVLELPPDLEA